MINKIDRQLKEQFKNASLVEGKEPKISMPGWKDTDLEGTEWWNHKQRILIYQDVAGNWFVNGGAAYAVNTSDLDADELKTIKLLGKGDGKKFSNLKQARDFVKSNKLKGFSQPGGYN